MANFFRNNKDLEEWIKNTDDPENILISIIGKGKEQDIVEICRQIKNEKNNSF